MRITRLVLQTTFLETLAEFYSKILELPVQPGDRRTNIKMGDTELVFVESENSEPFYHFAINIPANKIEESKLWMENKVKLIYIEDYKSEIAEFVSWNARSIYFFDPAGNILELISRFDLDNGRDEPFSSSQFLSISEAGIVFPQQQFEKKVTELLDNYSLSYFSRQSPLPSFRAIGDNEGLFIAVPEHRSWYPTKKSAGIYPMTIDFVNEGKKYQLSL